MTIEENLHQLDRDLEADLMEAQRQLKLGKEEAIAELNRHREELAGASKEAAELFSNLVSRADRTVEDVREQIGGLNFVLAHDDFADLAAFEEYRVRLLLVMEEAIAGLQVMANEGDEKFKFASRALTRAWNQLLQRIELVRIHLLESERVAMTELDSQRLELAFRLEEMRIRGDSKPLTELKEGFRGLWPWVEAFFQNPDVSAPAKPARPVHKPAK